jgi:hypothetical protein
MELEKGKLKYVKNYKIKSSRINKNKTGKTN